ncbi:MAG: type II toxin-antitoxin system VapB family antitoxin [Terriglobales bacterium]
MKNTSIADVSRESHNPNPRTMRTTIDIDDALMSKAMRLSGLTTKKAVVEAALRLLIQTHSQVGIRRLRDKVKREGNPDEPRRGRD